MYLQSQFYLSLNLPRIPVHENRHMQKNKTLTGATYPIAIFHPLQFDFGSISMKVFRTTQETFYNIDTDIIYALNQQILSA